MESVTAVLSAELSQLMLLQQPRDTPQDTTKHQLEEQQQQQHHHHHHHHQQQQQQQQQSDSEPQQCQDCCWSDLPYPCLVRIMCQVSTKDRLQSCSLVCCSWLDAAASATGSILVPHSGSLSEYSTYTLALWVRKHGSALRKLQLGLPNSFNISITRMLFRELVSATQLTSLSLVSTYILHRRDPFCCKQLMLLPRLQQLELNAGSRVMMLNQDLILSKALSKLQSLTQLKISGKFQGHPATMSLRQLWALTQLQHLDLFVAEAGYSYFRRCPGEMFDGLSGMTQLTALSLAAPFRYLGATSSLQGSLRGPTELLPGLEQLTQLQVLKLQRSSSFGRCWVQPALLSKLTCLRHLALKFDWLGPRGSGEQELMQLLPKMQQLTGLELHSFDLRACSLTVLTSLAPVLCGSNLRRLSLDHTQLPMFHRYDAHRYDARNAERQSSWQHLFSSGGSSTPLQLESLSLCSVSPQLLPADVAFIARRCCKLAAFCSCR
jgi:hypothetical protein